MTDEIKAKLKDIADQLKLVVDEVGFDISISAHHGHDIRFIYTHNAEGWTYDGNYAFHGYGLSREQS